MIIRTRDGHGLVPPDDIVRNNLWHLRELSAGLSEDPIAIDPQDPGNEEAPTEGSIRMIQLVYLKDGPLEDGGVIGRPVLISELEGPEKRSRMFRLGPTELAAIVKAADRRQEVLGD